MIHCWIRRCHFRHFRHYRSFIVYGQNIFIFLEYEFWDSLHFFFHSRLSLPLYSLSCRSWTIFFFFFRWTVPFLFKWIRMAIGSAGYYYYLFFSLLFRHCKQSYNGIQFLSMKFEHREQKELDCYITHFVNGNSQLIWWPLTRANKTKKIAKFCEVHLPCKRVHCDDTCIVTSLLNSFSCANWLFGNGSTSVCTCITEKINECSRRVLISNNIVITSVQLTGFRYA